MREGGREGRRKGGREGRGKEEERKRRRERSGCSYINCRKSQFHA